jgi:hypothetical protein
MKRKKVMPLLVAARRISLLPKEHFPRKSSQTKPFPNPRHQW